MNRRTFLGSMAVATVLPYAVMARGGTFLWKSYGADPLAEDYGQAIVKLPEVLDLMVNAGKINQAQAEKLKDIRARQNPKSGKIRSGDRFDAMAYHRGRPIIQTDVQAAFGEGFVADTAEWELAEGETRIQLILPVRGVGPDGRKIERCYNWAIRIGAAVCDAYTFYVAIQGVSSPVRLTWNFWRPQFGLTELLNDPCVCLWDAQRTTCGKPTASCYACPPNWTYGGRGKPDVILSTLITSAGYLQVPKRFLNPTPLLGTELLICSYETQFSIPSTRRGEGRLANAAYLNRFWGHGGNAAIEPLLFVA